MRSHATLIAIVTIALLGGLYVFLKGTGGPSASQPSQARSYHLVIRGTQLTGGPTVLDATQGDSVQLIVSTDQAGTLHLHGYEKLLPVATGDEARLSFVASRAGWFPVGLHDLDGNETTLAALQVQPVSR